MNSVPDSANPDAANPLDQTAVHPESYAAAEAILNACGFSLSAMTPQTHPEILAAADRYGLDALAKQAGVGVPTMNDILQELLNRAETERIPPPPLLRSGDIMESKKTSNRVWNLRERSQYY